MLSHPIRNYTISTTLGLHQNAHPNQKSQSFQVSSEEEETMIEKSYGPHGYAMHEDNIVMENEYQSNSMQMMPPQYSKGHHMSFSAGTHGGHGGHGAHGSHGSYSDVWHGNGKTNFQNGYHSQSMGPNGYSSSNAHYSHASGGRMPGMPGPGFGPGRVSNNMMTNSSEFETYHAGPRGNRMKMQNFGMQSESYDDYATGMHGGRQKVEYKNL